MGNPSRKPGFTLVELLVVIGIITLLIGILLPVIARARQSGNAVACQSNLHQLTTALYGYAAENKGSLPWGFYWRQTLPDGEAGNPFGIVHWSTLINKYFHGRFSGEALGAGELAASHGEDWSGAFRCPEVPAGTFEQAVTYANHPVAMPNLSTELCGQDLLTSLGDCGGRLVATPAGTDPIKPAKMTQLYPDNALLWDTNASPFFFPNDPDFGNWYAYGPSFSLIDGAQLTNAPYPELRYRDRYDHFATTPGMRLNEPIWLGDQSAGWPINRDLGGDVVWFNQVNDARFRHFGNTVCNVAFADGSVRGLKISKRINAQGSPDSEFLRKYLMIKWPSNVTPGGYPGYLP